MDVGDIQATNLFKIYSPEDIDISCTIIENLLRKL